MIRGAIFDGDGTLLDSMPIWVEAGSRWLLRHGFTPPEGMGDALGPLSLMDTAAYLKKHFPISDATEAIEDDVMADVEHFYRQEVCCKPGIPELLATLQQKSVPMVIATGGDPALLRTALEHRGVFHYFDAVLSCWDWNTSKHQPLIYQKAAEYLGISPAEALVFEDAPYAVRSAVDGGFPTVGVIDPAFFHRTRPEAGFWVEDFTDLRPVLEFAGLLE